MAAKFDGHGAGVHLKKRCNNSSPQQLESYILLAKNHRHNSGISMPLHIDQYEAILGYMPDCGKIPTNTERIDWFIPTVSEDIYASAKAMCRKFKALSNGETWYFFSITPASPATHLQGEKCALHPDGNHTTADCKKLRQLQLNPSGRIGMRTGERAE
jgi:hypothetical protein